MGLIHWFYNLAHHFLQLVGEYSSHKWSFRNYHVSFCQAVKGSRILLFKMLSKLWALHTHSKQNAFQIFAITCVTFTEHLQLHWFSNLWHSSASFNHLPRHSFHTKRNYSISSTGGLITSIKLFCTPIHWMSCPSLLSTHSFLKIPTSHKIKSLLLNKALVSSLSPLKKTVILRKNTFKILCIILQKFYAKRTPERI